MGSILNFVFLSNTLSKNGNESFMEGPLFYYINERNRDKYSYTLNGIIKKGFCNVLLLEPVTQLSSVNDIDDTILSFVKNNDIKILFSSLANPSTKIDLNDMYKIINENSIENKFILVESNHNLNGECYTIDYFLEETTWELKNWFSGINELGYTSVQINESELNTFRNKKFLSFNRTTDKPHRLSLYHEYLSDKYSDSYFSFLNKVEYVRTIPNYGDITDRYDYYNSKLPIELDTQEIPSKEGFSISDTFKKELFIDSCIHIVTETSFELNQLFISEKINKPILMYQPFIVFGPHLYLKRLREYGFKTFSNFWDESYDEIEDYEERILSIIDLIKSLNKKSIEELNELYQKTKNICIYNREHMYSLKLDSFPKIFKQIENEW